MSYQYNYAQSVGGRSTETSSNSYRRTSHRRNHESHERSRAMKALIDDILLHIKAFDGDVFGGVVRDYKTMGTVYVRDINCRIDNIMLQVFLQTLNVYYNVQEICLDVGGYFVGFAKRVKVSRKDIAEDDSILYSSNYPTSVFVYLDIVLMSRNEWMRLPCDFDVNLLAENSNSLFLRSHYVSLHKYTDRLNFVTTRIKDNTFCLLEDANMKTPEQLNVIIDRAARMVMRGWVMDDTLLGDKSWVISTWSLLSNQLRMVRKKYDKAKYDKMVSMKECAICNEEIKKCDIVINTRCNHVFHWQDYPVNNRNNSNNESLHSCKGLKEWVRRGNITCPVCRQLMF